MHPKRARSLHDDLFSGAVVEKVRTSVMETRSVKRRDEKGKDEKGQSREKRCCGVLVRLVDRVLSRRCAAAAAAAAAVAAPARLCQAPGLRSPRFTRGLAKTSSRL